MISFRTISIVSSLLAVALSVCLIIYPSLYLYVLGVSGNDVAFMLGRRTATLFLGFSVVAYSARNATHSDARQAICLGLSIAMLAMSLLGVVEFLRGAAKATVFIFILVELFFALCYFLIWNECRKQSALA